MNRFGLTSGEIEAFGLHAIRIRQPKRDWNKIGGIVLLLVLLGILLIQTFLMPLTVVHAEESVNNLTDRQQEKRYCAMALTGTPVEGATTQQLLEHCKKFIN